MPSGTVIDAILEAVSTFINRSVVPNAAISNILYFRKDVIFRGAIVGLITSLTESCTWWNSMTFPRHWYSVPNGIPSSVFGRSGDMSVMAWAGVVVLLNILCGHVNFFLFCNAVFVELLIVELLSPDVTLCLDPVSRAGCPRRLKLRHHLETSSEL